MAKDLGGVWRTIGGRRVFIKDGEDLSTAMKNSGKFSNKKEKAKEQAKKYIKNNQQTKKISDMTDEEKEIEIKKLQEEMSKTSLFDPKRQEMMDKKNMLEDNFDGTLEEYRAKKEKEKQDRLNSHKEKEKQKVEKYQQEENKKLQLEKDIKEAPKDKLEQYNIIQKTNPMLDEYHTGIRSPKDIKRWEEVVDDDESFAWGDFSREDAKKSLETGMITVYSSYDIKDGVFVSTSKKQAQEYAGGEGNKVFEKRIPINEVAWINGDEGQFAKVKPINGLKNAFEEYKKEHPNSKISLSYFEKNIYK